MGNCCQKTQIIPDHQCSEGKRVKNGGWKRKIAKRMKLAKFSPRVDIISTDDGSNFPDTSTEPNVMPDTVQQEDRHSSIESGTLYDNDSAMVLFYARQYLDEDNVVIRAETDNINPSVEQTNDVIRDEGVHLCRLDDEDARVIEAYASTDEPHDYEKDFTTSEILEAPVVINEVIEANKDETEEKVVVKPLPQGSLFTQSKTSPFFSSDKFVNVDFDDVDEEIEEDISDEERNVKNLRPFSPEEDDKRVTMCANLENTIVKFADDANKMNNGSICMNGQGLTESRFEKMGSESEQATETNRDLKRCNQVNIKTPILTCIDEPVNQRTKPIDPVKRGKICKAYLLYLKSLGEETTTDKQTLTEGETGKDNCASVKNSSVKQVDITDALSMTAANVQANENRMTETRDDKSPTDLSSEKTTNKSVLVNYCPIKKDDTCKAAIFSMDTPREHRENKSNKAVNSDKTRTACTSSVKAPEKRVTGNSNVKKRNITCKDDTTAEKTKRKNKIKRIMKAKRHMVRRTDTSTVHTPGEQATENSKAVKTKQNETHKFNIEKIFKTKKTDKIKAAKRDETCIIKSFTANTHETRETDIKATNKHKVNTTTVKTFKAHKIKDIETSKTDQTRRVYSIPINTPETHESARINVPTIYKIPKAYTPSMKSFKATEVGNVETAKKDVTRLADSTSQNVNEVLKTNTLNFVKEKESRTAGSISTLRNANNVVVKMDQTLNSDDITASKSPRTEETENKETTKRNETRKTYVNSVETPQSEEIRHINMAKRNDIYKTNTTSGQTTRAQEINHRKAAKPSLEELFTDPITGNSKFVAKCDINKTVRHYLEIEREQNAGNNDYLNKNDSMLEKKAGGIATKFISFADKHVFIEDETSGENTKDELKESAYISVPVAGTSQTISNECIPTADGLPNRSVRGFKTKSEPSLSSENSSVFENLKPTRIAATCLSHVNEELKRKISQTLEQSLEKLGNRDGKKDCLLSIFVHPVDPDEEPKPVQVRAPHNMIRDGSAETFVKNLAKGIMTADIKKFGPLGKPNTTSKQHLKKSSSLATTDGTDKEHCTQKRVFPGILPPKIKERLEKKMEARKPIN